MPVSTIARRVAKELSFIYVDTGAMYRAMALYLLHKNVDRTNKEQIGEVCQNAEISIEYQNGEQIVLLNGENVNAYLRTEEVGNMASVSSAVPRVREKLLSLQRKLAKDMSVVMDGRDIGTTILPDADVKSTLLQVLLPVPKDVIWNFRKKVLSVIWIISRRILKSVTSVI